MNVSREAVYAALFAKLSALPGVVTVSRRLKHWSDVAPALQPALFMVQKHERPKEMRGAPPAWTLSVELFFYAHSGGDPIAIPAETLNRLLDAMEAALAPDPATGVQTLGGLVSHAWIAGGGIETDEGVLGDQAVAIVPIEMLV